MNKVQVFVDDSGSENGDQRLFMCGYWGTPEVWGLFNQAWAGHLAAEPAITCLKTSEAARLQGQFKGWTQEARDRKLEDFALIIESSMLVSFGFSVSRQHVMEFAKPVFPHGLSSAHFWLTVAIILKIPEALAMVPWRGEVSYVFDQQSGVDDDLPLFFNLIMESLPKSAKGIVQDLPVFGDDKVHLPLQAADMLAHSIRSEHEAKALGRSPDRSPPIAPAGHFTFEIDEATIKSWHMAFSKMPGIAGSQGSRNWKRAKVHMKAMLAAGYIPPYGTRWKNWKHAMRERIRRIFSGR